MRLYKSNLKTKNLEIQLQAIFRQGLVTREGKTFASLRELNKYRSYLHNITMDKIKSAQAQTECDDIQKLVVTTVIKQRNEQEFDDDSCDSGKLEKKYSEILRDEVKGICDRALNEFETTPFFREFCEGERQNLLKSRQILLNQIQMKALVKLRNLEKYEARQGKFLGDWIKRSEAEIQDRADELVKEEALRYEKCKNIREYSDTITCLWSKIKDDLQLHRDRHNEKMEQMIQNARTRVCKKSQRQYPLSAQCPYNFLEGGTFGDPCPYEDLVRKLEGDLYYNEEAKEGTFQKQANWRSRGKDSKESTDFSSKEAKKVTPAVKQQSIREEEEGEDQQELPTIDESFIYSIIRNAVALATKHIPCRPILNREQSKFKTIRIRYFTREMANVVKEEMRDLLKNNLELLVALIKTTSEKENEETLQQRNSDDQANEEVSNWDGAPPLKSSSNTITGRYIRDQLKLVSSQKVNLGKKPLDKNLDRHLFIERQLQNAITEATSAKDLNDLACQLIDGLRTICEAREILEALEKEASPLQEKDHMTRCLITAVIRTVLITIKESITCGALEIDDLCILANVVNKEDEISKEIVNCQHIQDLIDRYSDDLMKNRCMKNLIKDTARKIRCTKDNSKPDEEISKHLSNAARKFVTKVLENIMSESGYQVKKGRKDTERMYSSEKQNGEPDFPKNESYPHAQQEDVDRHQSATDFNIYVQEVQPNISENNLQVRQEEEEEELNEELHKIYEEEEKDYEKFEFYDEQTPDLLLANVAEGAEFIGVNKDTGNKAENTEVNEYINDEAEEADHIEINENGKDEDGDTVNNDFFVQDSMGQIIYAEEKNVVNINNSSNNNFSTLIQITNQIKHPERAKKAAVVSDLPQLGKLKRVGKHSTSSGVKSNYNKSKISHLKKFY